MSLFPAYQSEEKKDAPTESEWLSNPSFQDVPSAPPPLTSSSSSSSSEEEKRISSPKRREKKRKKKRRRDYSPSKEELIAEFSKNKTFIEETGLAPEFAFRIDSKRDSGLLKQRDLPIKPIYYKRNSLSSGKQAFLKKKSPRFFQREFLKKFSKREPEILSSSNVVTPTSEYIRFQTTTTDVNKDDPLGIYDSSTLSYLNKRSEEKKENVEEEDEIVLDEARLKTKKFNEQLRKNPNCVETWIAYVDFQDEAFESSIFDGEELSKEQKGSRKRKKKKNPIVRNTAVIKKKLSILQTAIDKNPKSVQLATKRLEISKEILDTKTLENQWKELLFLFPIEFELWKDYLRFKMTHFTSFSKESVLAAFRSCFRKLCPLSEQMNRPDNLEKFIIEIFSYLVYFLRNIGHWEMSIALFQAAIEFNFFSPPFHGSCSFADRLATFEQFWDSKLPRFGETGAVGWATTIKNKTFANHKSESPSQVWKYDLINRFKGSSRSKFSLWLEIELKKSQYNWLPWRCTKTFGEDDEMLDSNDPIMLDYNLVSFIDISPFIFHFIEESSKSKLLFIFIQYLNGITGVSHYHRKNFLSNVGLSPETVNVNLPWLDTQRVEPQLMEKSFVSFVREVFKQVLVILNKPLTRTQIATLWMRFETKYSDGLSEIREFLSKYPTEIELYSVYAKYEYERLEGGFKIANKVLSKCLKANSAYNQCLYHTVINVELEEIKKAKGNPERTKRLLILSGLEQDNNAEINDDISIAIFQMQSKIPIWINQKIETEVFVNSEYFGALDRIYVYLWLKYFETGLKGVDEAVGVCKSLAKDPYCAQGEFLLKFKIDAYINECEKKRDKTLVRFIRKDLIEGIRQFPLNDYFSKMIVKYEECVSAVSSIWHFVLHSSNSSATILSVTQSLIQKYHECQGEDSTTALGYLNKAYNLINRSIEKFWSCRRTPSLWRVLFWIDRARCINHPTYTSDVHDIFYRSVQECPSAKALYLDVIYYSTIENSSLDSDNRNTDVINLMFDKEISARTTTEELDVLLAVESDEEYARMSDDDQKV